jgi:penicillin-insensitive murein endopeptidase
MLTPFDAIIGLWLMAGPAPGAAMASLAAPSAPAAPKSVSADTKPADAPAALLELSDEELRARIEEDSLSVGSLSIGTPSAATLFNGVALQADPLWEIAPHADTFGTSETLAAIRIAVDTVSELFSDTPPIVIGDISALKGGHLKRHQTHQGGRDVDFGFYYKAGKGAWFVPGTAANMDLPRNWAFVRALVTRTDVETILLDTRIQRVLYQYALGIGEARDWLDRVFQFSRGSSESIIRHVAGHRTHYHVRFYNPVAQELGRRAHPLLVELNLMSPSVYTVSHVVQPGQTLGRLASQYRTPVRAIMQANGLRTAQLRVGHAYRIPMRGAPPPTTQPLVVRPRILPTTTPPTLATIDWPTVESLYGSSQER